MSEITGWFTSSWTQGQGQCVEVGFGEDQVAVRDSKDPGGGQITVTSQRWREFIAGIKAGGFDGFPDRG